MKRLILLMFLAFSFYGCEDTTTQDINETKGSTSLINVISDKADINTTDVNGTQEDSSQVFIDRNETNASQTQEVLTYTLVIDENFTSYDESLWMKADWANGNPFYSAWCPEQVDINESNLTLSLVTKSCHDKEFASGEYRTLNTYMYGKYTSRFRASDLNGTISSFFTYTGSAEGTEWDEIDVEILGRDTTKVQLNYWRDGHEHPKLVELGFDASLSMHTYSFIFTPEFIEWYVDDTLVHRVDENHLENNDSLPVNEGKVILNFWAATGIDSWSGHYEDNTTSSVTYEFVSFEKLND